MHANHKKIGGGSFEGIPNNNNNKTLVLLVQQQPFMQRLNHGAPHGLQQQCCGARCRPWYWFYEEKSPHTHRTPRNFVSCVSFVVLHRLRPTMAQSKLWD